jgi:hypothetical protein
MHLPATRDKHFPAPGSVINFDNRAAILLEDESFHGAIGCSVVGEGVRLYGLALTVEELKALKDVALDPVGAQKALGLLQEHAEELGFGRGICRPIEEPSALLVGLLCLRVESEKPAAAGDPRRDHKGPAAAGSAAPAIWHAEASAAAAIPSAASAPKN